MRYLQLEQHLIPVILIKRIEQREEEGIEEGAAVIYTSTVIHFRDNTELTVDEEFEDICNMLNPMTLI